MSIGKSMNVKSNTNVARIIGRTDQYLSPLGGSTSQAPLWATRNLHQRDSVNSNVHVLTNLRAYASRSQSFSGVSSVYGVSRGAFTRGGYVK